MRSFKTWTDLEHDTVYFLHIHLRKSNGEIADILGRSERSIEGRIRMMRHNGELPVVLA